MHVDFVVVIISYLNIEFPQNIFFWHTQKWNYHKTKIKIIGLFLVHGVKMQYAMQTLKYLNGYYFLSCYFICSIK